MLPEVFYFLKGYVIIQIKGNFSEKFINIALKRDIYIWDIKRVDKNTITMKMSIRGYKRLRGAGKKCGCTVKILEKKGLPFHIRKHKGRTALLSGGVVFAAAVLVLSNLLWSVEITGLKTIEYAELEKELAECGLRSGIWVSSVDVTEVTQKLLAKNNRITWAGINLKGAKAFVEVVEGVPKPQMVEKDVPCNIVSAKNGVIDKLIVKNGFPVVKVGDTVNQGQLLVSGLVDSKIVSMRYLHSEAEVKIKTWYERTKTIPLLLKERVATGNLKSRYKLKLGSLEIPLYFKGKAPYDEFELETSQRSVLGMPVGWIKNTYREMKTEERMQTVNEAFDAASEDMKKELSEELSADGEMLNFTAEYVESEGQIQVKAIMEALENGGVQVPIQ